MIYTIATKDLQAVSLAMANKDIRYYLNGVLFELDDAGGYRIVGTDGYRMHIVCKRKAQAVDSVIMPRETVVHILKQKVQACFIELIPGETRQIKIATGAGFITVPEVKGKYPDYRRVMPKQLLPQIEPAHYMPEYLADLAKAQKIIGTEKQHGYLAQQGSSGGVYVDNEKSFYAVIMPLRFDAPESSDFERGLAKVQARITRKVDHQCLNGSSKPMRI